MNAIAFHLPPMNPPPRRFLRTCALLLVASICFQARAATLTVTNTADLGAGSLRAALAAAADGDVIVFDPSVTGQITLTTGQLQINRSVTIAGPGANLLAVSGNALTRVFYISPNHTVTIGGLTIMNGRGVPGLSFGGGIWNDHSNLTVTNCTLRDNAATGGGAIANDGSNSGTATLVVMNSTLSGNSAGSGGGGIYNTGANGFGSSHALLTVTNSTFSGNSALNDGGGIYNAGTDGDAQARVTHCTFSGNSCARAGYGGGIENFIAGLTIGHTVLSAGASGKNIYTGNGSVTSLGFNLSSDDSAGLIGTGDRSSLAPLLGPLQDNLGPTHTHALLADSPARDMGDPNFPPPPPPPPGPNDPPAPPVLPAPVYDQRGSGFPRVMGARIDIGAFEAFAGPAPVINSPLTATGTVGTPFSYFITATNSPTSYNATGGMPAGLSVNSSTGEISGTPTNVEVTNVTLAATNASGTGYATLQITINQPASVNFANLQQLYDGTPKSVAVSTSPAGLATTVVYNGSATPPTAVGRYAVLATVTEAGFSGSASATLVISTAGALSATGANLFGALGDGTTTDRRAPVEVLEAGTVVAAGAGRGHSMFLGSDGILWGMGWNADGQLGDGTTTTRLLPVPVQTGVVAVAAGLYHTAFVKSDGTLYTMGSLAGGTGEIFQLGDFSGVVTVAAGLSEIAFVKSDGTLWVIDEFLLMSAVPGVTNAVAVAQGLGHTVFLRADGTLWAMGQNENGQLGDNTTTNRTTPAPVLNATNVVAFAAGDSHTGFVKADGTLWLAGSNLSGQLGDGTFADRHTPVQVPGVSSAVAVSAGSAHTVFALQDGTVWAMGSNDSGQLGGGDGAPLTTSTPIQVQGVSAPLVAAGGFHTLFVGAAPVTPLAPQITSSLQATATYNQDFFYQITASNSPTSFNASGLPSGMTIDSTTGVISGKPTDLNTWQVTLFATNAAGTGQATLELTIYPAPPGITSALTATGTVGTPFTYSITASNSPTSFNATSLPPGLSVNAATGEISGTPTAAGITNVTISAANAGGSDEETLQITINPPATSLAIVTQPVSVNVVVGQTAVFSVGANSTFPITYQWYKNAKVIPGATAATLTLTNVQTGDADRYRVVVTSNGVSLVSDWAMLTVLVPPTITKQPEDLVVGINRNATFTVRATGTTPLMYLWYKNGQPIPGATSSRLQLMRVTLADAGVYHVVVSNSGGETVSSPATLTVQ